MNKIYNDPYKYDKSESPEYKCTECSVTFRRADHVRVSEEFKNVCSKCRKSILQARRDAENDVIESAEYKEIEINVDERIKEKDGIKIYVFDASTLFVKNGRGISASNLFTFDEQFNHAKKHFKILEMPVPTDKEMKELDKSFKKTFA